MVIKICCKRILFLFAVKAGVISTKQFFDLAHDCVRSTLFHSKPVQPDTFPSKHSTDNTGFSCHTQHMMHNAQPNTLHHTFSDIVTQSNSTSGRKRVGARCRHVRPISWYHSAAPALPVLPWRGSNLRKTQKLRKHRDNERNEEAKDHD